MSAESTHACGSVWLAVRDGMYLFIDLADNDRTHTAPAAQLRRRR